MLLTCGVVLHREDSALSVSKETQKSSFSSGQLALMLSFLQSASYVQLRSKRRKQTEPSDLSSWWETHSAASRFHLHLSSALANLRLKNTDVSDLMTKHTWGRSSGRKPTAAAGRSSQSAQMFDGWTLRLQAAGRRHQTLQDRRRRCSPRLSSWGDLGS